MAAELAADPHPMDFYERAQRNQRRARDRARHLSRQRGRQHPRLHPQHYRHARAAQASRLRDVGRDGDRHGLCDRRRRDRAANRSSPSRATAPLASTGWRSKPSAATGSRSSLSSSTTAGSIAATRQSCFRPPRPASLRTPAISSRGAGRGSLLFDTHDALAHLDLIADIRQRGRARLRRRARSARAPSSSLRPPRGAGPPRPRRPPRHKKPAMRPFIGARTPPSPSSAPPAEPSQGSISSTIGLPAAGEGFVNALGRLEQGDFRWRRAHARGGWPPRAHDVHRRSHAGVRTCRRSAHRARAARADELDEFAIPQGSYGASRRLPRGVAAREQEFHGGEDSALV